MLSEDFPVASNWPDCKLPADKDGRSGRGTEMLYLDKSGKTTTKKLLQVKVLNKQTHNVALTSI